MRKDFYDLNNPKERARLILDSVKYFKSEKVLLTGPAALIYTFNNVIEAIEFVFWHQHVDFESSFVESHIQERPACIYMRSTYGSYSINCLSYFEYEYKANDNEAFIKDQKAKLEIMEREFNSNFSNNELEEQMTNQALAILDNNSELQHNSAIDNKLESFLNRYFNHQWISYSVESMRLDNISTQYTLKVKYNTGETIELRKPSQKR